MNFFSLVKFSFGRYDKIAGKVRFDRLLNINHKSFEFESKYDYIEI